MRTTQGEWHAELFPSSTPGEMIRVGCSCSIGRDHDHLDGTGGEPTAGGQAPSDWKDAMPGHRFTVFRRR